MFVPDGKDENMNFDINVLKIQMKFSYNVPLLLNQVSLAQANERENFVRLEDNNRLENQEEVGRCISNPDLRKLSNKYSSLENFYNELKIELTKMASIKEELSRSITDVLD